MFPPTPFLPQRAADQYCLSPPRKRQRESDTQTASSEQEAAGPQTTPMHEGAAAWDTWQREGTAPRSSLSQQVPGLLGNFLFIEK